MRSQLTVSKQLLTVFICISVAMLSVTMLHIVHDYGNA